MLTFKQIVNGNFPENALKVYAEPKKESGTAPIYASNNNNIPSSAQLLAQESLQPKTKPTRDVFLCSSSSSNVDEKAQVPITTTTTTTTASLSKGKFFFI
jgi:hypothetical protein